MPAEPDREISPEISRRRLPSLRLLITLVVVVPIAVVSLALIVIATVTSRSVAEQLGEEIVVDTSRQISTDVRNYLSGAVRVSDLYTHRMQDAQLSTADLSTWQRTMFHDLAVNPDVASICFSTPEGDCTWLLRAHGRLELGLVHGGDRDHAVEFPVDDRGVVDRAHPIRIYHYDATARPWFKTALAADVPAWTPVYFWFGQKGPASETGTGYTRTVRNADGKLLGVLVIDVALAALSDHLRIVALRRNANAFIVDSAGLLVATSDGQVNSVDGARLSLEKSPSPAARAVADIFARDREADQNDPPPAFQAARITIAGEPARVRTNALSPYYGIDWQLATVLPESTFLHVATIMQQRAIVLALGAIAAGVTLGLYLSRRLSDPLIKLSRHVVKVGAGDFDSRLDLAFASEMRNLSDQLNQMAKGLKQRMALEHSLAVAQQVQQGLLPARVPTVPGLEIAACCKFCDATGGDYYDFIEIESEDDARKQILFAVGDATGHGIGAALLMATARGAVRSAVRSGNSGNVCLGDILTHANLVLVANEQHGSFVTLSLLLIDPSAALVKWSSAGHDPTLVYHPNTDSFEELGAGEIPLGVEANVQYEESQRAIATPGTVLVMGTDGIWEARNPAGEMFGRDRLRELMRQHNQTADELSDAIKSSMYGFIGPSPLSDDATFIVIRVV